MTFNTAPNPKRRLRLHPMLWLGAALLLAFPALGMVMSPEVRWGPEDFLIFALLLVGLCAGIEAALHLFETPRWRIGAGVMAVLVFLTIWAHLAVGLFD